MARNLPDPLAPITISQSKASAVTRGVSALVCGSALLVCALVAIINPESTAMAIKAPFIAVFGFGVLGFGLSQLKLSKQENRIHFHADLNGLTGLIVTSQELVPWSSVSKIDGFVTDVTIYLVEGDSIYIREGLVGMTKGLAGLPSAKKIAQRLENLRNHAQMSETSPQVTEVANN